MSRWGREWLCDPEGNPRGYIQPKQLQELWFHAGTVCNLRCPFCLEGSKPGDNRLNPLTLEDARPFIEETVSLGVEQRSFTGGEPFVIPEMTDILNFALGHKSCMVLTNATEPLPNKLHQLMPLRNKENALTFRVSLDYPDPEAHDAGFHEPQEIERSNITIDNDEVQEKVGDIQFNSITLSLVKP